MNYFIIIFFTLVSGSLTGQIKSSLFLECLESKSERDDLVVNGKIYLPPNPKINGPLYFEDLVHEKGSVFISGQAYQLEMMKLDLYQNQLVLREKLSNSATVELILSPTLIDSFNLEKHFFINNKILSIPEQTQHYIELIGTGKYKLYRISDITYYDQINSRNPNGKFGLKQANFFLNINESLESFVSKRELLNYFPKHKRDINQFMRKEKIKIQAASLDQLISLVNYLNELD